MFVPGLDARHTSHKNTQGPQRILVLDGSNVHNVGELHTHVGNWGLFGSLMGSNNTFSHAPSGEWPAGSGNEYLYGAGMWFGAIKSGIPAVTTSVYQTEFRPTPDPIDIIYRASEGDPGGARGIDDDSDGKIDEDWLDGRDNDGDSSIDEDFAAISDQMFSCWYTDNEPIASAIYPQHNPHDIMVRQETYQWADDRFDDFIGIEYTIKNIGTEILEDIYIGIFMDAEVARGSKFHAYWEDDAAGRRYNAARCTNLGPVTFDVAYMFDADGDRGAAGYIGTVLLGHPTDPTGEVAPTDVQFSGYANFAGDLPFESGGDPTNDFERYELLSQQSIDRDALIPRDYRTLASIGPFADLRPDSTMTVQFALVAGQDFNEMMTNAANAALAFKGIWVDADLDPLTGIAGRDYPVVGPANDVPVDTCLCPTCPPVPFVLRGDTLWINTDCEQEEFYKVRCGYTDADSLLYKTGVGGREKHLPWTLPTSSTAQSPKADPRQRTDFQLSQNYPNPFNPTTTIAFELAEPSRVTITLYTADGARVKTLIDAVVPRGRRTVDWDGTDDRGNVVSSGIYFYRMQSGEKSFTRKLVFIK